MNIPAIQCECGHLDINHQDTIDACFMCQCKSFSPLPENRQVKNYILPLEASECICGHHFDRHKAFQGHMSCGVCLPSGCADFNSRYVASHQLKADITHMADGVDQFQREVLGLDCTPTMLSASRYQFRDKFLREELDEFNKAYDAKDRDGVLDALGDLIYVAYGGILEMNVPPRDVFDAIQQSNMAKKRGVTKRGEHFDAMKPEGWLPPDHNILLAALELRAKVSPAFIEATKIRLERAAKYNGAGVELSQHFPLGHFSYFQMIWLKTIRILTTMRMWMTGEAPIDYKVLRDSLLDGMNYADFWVRDLERLKAEEETK
jgi:predicted HAD superfamily Cof-like phosphohydrolase